MGRRKVEMKKIEDKTSRQVTFSKRKNGIMKKAHELCLLCDATVSLFLLSSSNKLHHYLTPGAQLKKIYDDYQKIKGIDIWTTHYEEMQEQKGNLLDINSMLRRQIRQRMGGDLEGMGIKELQILEQDMDKALDIIRAQKLHKIQAQTGTSRKKVKNLQQVHGDLLFNLEAKFQASHCCLAREDEEDYEGAHGNHVGGSGGNGCICMYGSSSDPCNPNIMQFEGGGYGNASIAIHDLRLA